MAKDPSSKYLDQLIENELYYILDTGGDVNGINYSGRQHTLLHRACKENSFKGVQLLLGSGADVNKLTASGTSVLCIAAFFADKETIKLLLSAGADVFSQEMMTPLKLALTNNFQPVCCLLTAQMILEIVFAMYPLNLPAYVLLWILYESNPEFAELSELQRITLIQNVIKSCRRIKERIR